MGGEIEHQAEELVRVAVYEYQLLWLVGDELQQVCFEQVRYCARPRLLPPLVDAINRTVGCSNFTGTFLFFSVIITFSLQLPAQLGGGFTPVVG